MVEVVVIGVDESLDWCCVGLAMRRVLLESDIVVGAERHLDRAFSLYDLSAERHVWSSPLSLSVDYIVGAHGGGMRVVVLATGDPMDFGIGVTLVRALGIENLDIRPCLGAFSLSLARLGWSRHESDCLTLHGRPLGSLRRFLRPEGRLLILSHDGGTPHAVSDYVREQGYGKARMWVLSDLGSECEKIDYFDSMEECKKHEFSDLNTIALDLQVSDSVNRLRPPYMLLNDDDIEHDGQITKEEVRSITLLRLRPYAGAHLWDLGAGCGSISLGWMLGGGKSTAIESSKKRCDLILKNANNWGVSDSLTVDNCDIETHNWEELKPPDAIFFGGGISSLETLEILYNKLKINGIIVANAVTLEACEILTAFHRKHSGNMSRIQIEKLDEIGTYTSFKPTRSIMQFWKQKS